MTNTTTPAKIAKKHVADTSPAALEPSKSANYHARGAREDFHSHSAFKTAHSTKIGQKDITSKAQPLNPI